MRLTSKFVAISVATALLCAAAAVWILRSGEPARATASGEIRPVWTETDWPFGADPWGKGKAFRCRADDCGGEVQLYVRAKLGFCNCATGVADTYLVTARLDGTSDADGLALFLVPREAPGVASRQPWNGLGMRASNNHGVTLTDVFVPAEEALTVPGAFVRMLRMSRGSFVGNQLAISACYLGAAQNVYDFAVERLTRRTFADSGRPIASSPMHQVIIGDMTERLETAHLWIRRQLELETSEPPLRPKPEVYRQWRIAKGDIAEACFQVVLGAFKACGTSAATMDGVIGRALRDLAMGLVMTFPAERGRLEAARIVTESKENALFASVPK